MMAFQHYRAPNDVNGNPRRLWVFYNEAGDIAQVVDEGYNGRAAVRDVGIPELPSVSITATEYRELLRDAS